MKKIIIVVYNQKIDKLPSFIQAEKLSEYYFVFCDNSTDSKIISYNESIKMFNNAIYLSMNGNVGLSKAYNNAIKIDRDKFDWIVILDQDTPITTEYFFAINEYLKSNEAKIYVPYVKSYGRKMSPSILRGFRIINKKYVNKNDKLMPINSGACIHRSVFDISGYYNENLFLDMIDYDFFKKCHDNSIKISVMDIVIEQEYSGFSVQTYQQAFKRFLNYKSDIIEYSKYSFFAMIHFKYKTLRQAIKLSLRYKKISFLIARPRKLNSWGEKK